MPFPVLLLACAHAPAPVHEAPTAPPPPPAAAEAPATVQVLLPPTASGVLLECGVHGGDGDNVPLTRQIFFEMSMTNLNTRPIVLEGIEWVTPLRSEELRVQLLREPVGLAAGEMRPLGTSRWLEDIELTMLDQGAELQADRDVLDVQLAVDWRHGEHSERSTQLLGVRWRSCFEPYPEDPDRYPFADEPDPPGLEAATVMGVLQAAQPRIRTCYEREVQRDPISARPMNPSFTIGPRGTVVGYQPNCKGCSAELLACIEGVFRSLVFPPPEAGGTVEVSFPLMVDPTR